LTSIGEECSPANSAVWCSFTAPSAGMHSIEARWDAAGGNDQTDFAGLLVTGAALPIVLAAGYPWAPLSVMDPAKITVTTDTSDSSKTVQCINSNGLNTNCTLTARGFSECVVPDSQGGCVRFERLASAVGLYRMIVSPKGRFSGASSGSGPVTYTMTIDMDSEPPSMAGGAFPATQQLQFELEVTSGAAFAGQSTASGPGLFGGTQGEWNVFTGTSS
jgi:hypothetical protein